MRATYFLFAILAGVILSGCVESQLGTPAGSRLVSQSVADPDFRFSEKQSIGFIPIYFQDWYRRPSPLISDQQREALFPNEVMNFREEAIFWSPGDRSRGFSELQEKQMYGYFRSALATRGYAVTYLPLERQSLHGSRTVEALDQSGVSTTSVSLEDSLLRFLPDSVGSPEDSRWKVFTVPLSPDRINADSVAVRYRAGQLPDLIMQAWFFQQGADYVRPNVSSSAGSNLVTRPRPRPDIYAQGVWLQVWAQPPHYRINVWSGAILRSSTKPDINLQAAGMIEQLLAREHFPHGMAALSTSKK